MRLDELTRTNHSLQLDGCFLQEFSHSVLASFDGVNFLKQYIHICTSNGLKQ